MKGIVRPMDELGRVVVPKEIRQFIPAGSKCDVTWEHSMDFASVTVHLDFQIATNGICPLCEQRGPLQPIGKTYCCPTCYAKLKGKRSGNDATRDREN